MSTDTRALREVLASADLRRLLDAEGLSATPVLAVAGRTGEGVPALRAELRRRVSARRAATDRLTADVDPRNAASLRVLGKLGFVETGRAERTFLLGDEWCDSVYLALPRPS